VHKTLKLLLNRHNNIVTRTTNYEDELSDDVKLELHSVYIMMNDDYRLYEVIDKLEELQILTAQEVRRLKIS
jgi:transcription elongation factor